MATELKDTLTKKKFLKCKITKSFSEIDFNDADLCSLELLNTKCDQVNVERKEVLIKFIRCVRRINSINILMNNRQLTKI